MNIIILGPREPVPPLRGEAIEKFTWGLATRLAQKGFNVTLIATCKKLGKKKLSGVDVHYISKPIRGSLCYLNPMLVVSHKMKKVVEKVARDSKNNCIIHSVYFYNN